MASDRDPSHRGNFEYKKTIELTPADLNELRGETAVEIIAPREEEPAFANSGSIVGTGADFFTSRATASAALPAATVAEGIVISRP